MVLPRYSVRIRAKLPWYKFSRKEFCPITAVHYAEYGFFRSTGNFEKAGTDELMLESSDVGVILSAADTASYHFEEVREQIKGAVGL